MINKIIPKRMNAPPDITNNRNCHNSAEDIGNRIYPTTNNATPARIEIISIIKPKGLILAIQIISKYQCNCIIFSFSF